MPVKPSRRHVVAAGVGLGAGIGAVALTGCSVSLDPAPKPATKAQTDADTRSALEVTRALIATEKLVAISIAERPKVARHLTALHAAQVEHIRVLIGALPKGNHDKSSTEVAGGAGVATLVAAVEDDVRRLEKAALAAEGANLAQLFASIATSQSMHLVAAGLRKQVR